MSSPDERPDFWLSNLRAVIHEAATPMRDHDDVCCRRAQAGLDEHVESQIKADHARRREFVLNPRDFLRHDGRGIPEFIDYAASAAARAEADAAVARMVARHVGDVATAQAEALDAVAWMALEHGLEVHVQRKWGSRFVGLELATPLRGHPCPVIYEHQDDGRWLEW